MVYINLMKFIHIADTHIKNLKYHYEYKAVFPQLYEQLREENAGLFAWPFPELPLDTSDEDVTEEGIGEGDDTADE